MERDEKAKRRKSVAESITGLLSARGGTGATLGEIYAAVKAEIGQGTPDASIRSVVYKRLVTAKSLYRPRFERFVSGGETRYRLCRER